MVFRLLVLGEKHDPCQECAERTAVVRRNDLICGWSISGGLRQTATFAVILITTMGTESFLLLEKKKGERPAFVLNEL